MTCKNRGKISAAKIAKISAVSAVSNSARRKSHPFSRGGKAVVDSPSPVAEMAYVVTKALERRAAEEIVEEEQKSQPASKKSPAKPAKKAATKIVKKAKKR